MEYFGKSRNGDYRRHRPSQEYSPDNRERSELQSSRKTTPSSNFENLNGNGDRNSQRTRSIDGTANGSGPRHLPLGGSNVFYGYGGPFRLDDDTDGSSEMDSSLDFKIQPWMDKITGGTFKRNYIDRYSFRPSLHHDSQNRMGDIPQFRRSNESSIGSYTKGSKSRTIKTILLIFLGIILIGIVAGVIAYFLSKKENGDATIKYYVASGEISLNEIFYEELSNSSSQEFKNLSFEFCGAISEALQNSTDNGDKYRLCEVIDFRNGSIKVRFKVYYVYTATIIITNETVQKDLNNSLIPQNAGLAQLSTLVIIRVSLKITVEVEIFQKENDPVATSLLSSTTPSTTIETTTVPAATTTTSVTTSTPTTLPTNATTQITLNDTSTPPTSTTPMNTTTADYSTTPDTATAETTEEFDATTEEAQLNITTTTITAESTADTKPTPTTTTENTIPETTESSTEESTIAVTTKSGSTTESRISETTESSTKSTIAVTTKSENSTESTIPVTTQTESTIPVTTQKESTIPVTTQTESTIPVTTQTESTIPVTTQTTLSSTENNKPTTTAVKDIITYVSSTEKTTLSTTIATERPTDMMSSVELTTTTETKNTAASATPMTSLASATDSSTTQTIITTTNTISMAPSTKSASTESTSKIIDTTSTEIPSTSTTGTETLTSIAPSTNNTNQSPSIPTDSTSVVSKVNEITSESTTVTESTTENMSRTTTNTPADNTTYSTTPIMETTSKRQESTQCNDCITDSTVDTKTPDSTTIFTIQNTFETTTAVTVEYTAGIRASRITAIVGESTTTQACVIIPDGEWLHVELSIDYNSSSYVIAKLDHNKIFEKPTSVDRFNGSINMNGDGIVARLTVDLTSPKSDFCTWDGRYLMKCSVTMNDTMQTRKSNGSQISITAPMAKVNINPGVDYTEGDLVTFNCSTNKDPNYSDVSLEINSFVMDQIIMSPVPSERNSDCSVNATWSARSPNPLTTNENGVVIRCIVKNSLLNKSETIEKILNVSAVDVAFSKYSYTTLTKEGQVIECIARGSSSILQNMTIIRDSAEIVTLDGSGTPIILTSENRYTVTKENDAGDVKLILRIKTVDCEDQGTYTCSVLTTKNDSRSSPRMNFNVIGATPTLTLNPDIYERFARRGLNHICTTEHTGDKESDKYLEIQVNRPDGTSGFRYSKKLPLPESEKEFNSENNITYINITGTIARFLLVSDFTTNNSCNNTQTIVFLLDRPMEFDKGIVKCVLRDDNFEYASATENITVIPDEYCFGYEDKQKRNHPNNDCFFFVNCAEDGGRMYATGDSCRTPGKCIDFSLGDCVDCHENFTCKGPEPVTTTLAPGKTYVQCSDVSQKEGLPITVNCTVLDDTFQSLNVTLISSANGNKEENVALILPDGSIQYQARPSPVLNTTFSVSPKYIHFVIGSSSCSEEGRYLLTDTNVSLDTQPSTSAFFFDNLVPVKDLAINSESLYKEGKPLIFNCTATVDSDHTELLGYYKLPSDNSYVKVQGEHTNLQTFTQNCTKSVIWRFDTGLLVSANLNGTKLKCLYNEISPEASEEKNVKIQSADVAFNTYKLKVELQNEANFTCLVRSTGSYKAIKILKIINSTTMIEMASYTPSSDSVQSVAGINANFSSNALTLIFTSVTCSDEGQYNCTVIMDDDSEQQPPLSLDVQIKTSPGSSSVELFVDPDIVENRDSGTHNCLGSVGYPEVGGHLEITFVHPLINYNITLNKNSPRTIYGNEIKIKSTLEPFTKDECKNMEKISFTINSTKNWNKGKIICEVKTQNGSVQKATKDDIFYVIDGSFCNSTNNQEIYFDHEKEDFCNTYIQCSRGKPFGRFCKPNWCVYIGRTYCDDCSTAVCSERVTTTEVTLSSFETTPVPVPRSLNCTSPSVYEGESATIPCSLNVSSFDFISIFNDKGLIMSIFENATVVYFGDSSSTFQGSLTGKTVIFIVKNLYCNNSVDYVFKLYNGGEVSSSVTANPLMKVKPLTPVIDIDYRLEMGKNQKFHTCKGYVGNPKGSLELEIKNASLASYNKYIPTLQSFDTPVYENCSYHLTLRFSIDLAKDNLTGQYIRCLAKNIESLENTDPIPRSNEVLIIPLPANPCSEGNGDYPHPRDCYHYLQCANNIAYAQPCAGGSCFNATAKRCL